MDPAAAIPELDATLAELASLGMRSARAITRMIEIEQQAADILAAALPDPANPASSLANTVTAGQAIDDVTTAANPYTSPSPVLHGRGAG